MSAFRRVHPKFNPNSRSDDSSMVATLSNQLAQVESELATATAARTGTCAIRRSKASYPRRSVPALRWIEASSKYGYNHPMLSECRGRTGRGRVGAADAADHANWANASKAASLRASLRQEQDRAVQQAALQ